MLRETRFHLPMAASLRLLLTVALLAVTVTPAFAAPATPATMHTFNVMLNGVSEVPGPGDPDGTGHAYLTFDETSGEVCYEIAVENIAAPTAGHIHQGAETAVGPVVVNLLTDPTQLAGCVTVDPAVVQAIIANPADYYVNIHNADFPPGAVRGQLLSTGTIFTVRVENVSGGTHFPGPFSPGAWAVFEDGAAPLFDLDQPDRGEGLEAIAEDGNPAMMAESLAGRDGVFFSGAFTTPEGEAGPAPLFPGQAYEFKIKATSPADRFTLATMLVQTNDIFVGPGANGIALFDADGNPIYGDITALNPFWDAGTEINEAPGMGPNHAPRQPAADTGPAEGVVSAFTNTTRGMPLADGVIAVELTENNGEFNFIITNISADGGSMVTPLSPLVYVIHNDAVSLFDVGAPASPGIEAVAEDGNAPVLVDELTGVAGIGMVNAAGAPIGPGGAFNFSVTPTEAYPYLSLATMVVESNDAFLAFGPEGIKLLDENGDPRSVDAILADFHREMVIWDAGTEANEVPGVGPNQVLRQAAANTGAADPTPGVRLYRDATNDLAGPNAGGFGEIIVTNTDTSGLFDVTLMNTSDTIVYPGVLTPVAWAIHNRDIQLFDPGMPATPGLERLAEDGNPAVLADELAGSTNVQSFGVVNTPDGAVDPGPIFPGGSYSWQVQADGDNRYLSVASMMVPSNDTFFAFEPAGLRIMNQDGTPRTDEEIAADIATQRLAWDAGTERNQAGAAGPDQAPRQAGPDTGMDEGAGVVSLLVGSDGVWHYPRPEEVVKITIEPMAMPMPNVIENPSFEDGMAPWRFFTSTNGNFTIGDMASDGESAARIEIDEAGRNVQLYQSGLTLEPNTRYRLYVDAKSNNGQDMNILIHQHRAPYTNYGARIAGVDLTTEYQTYVWEFTTANFDETVNDGRLRFWFAPHAEAGDVYMIDNVVLTKVNAEMASDMAFVAAMDDEAMLFAGGNVFEAETQNNPVYLPIVIQ